SLASPLTPLKSPLYQSGPDVPRVHVGDAVRVGTGVHTCGQPVVPFTPMEKSEGCPSLAVDVKLAPKKLLLKNAFWLLPHGVPTQLTPLVVVSKKRPLRSPIGVTLSQYVPGDKLKFSPVTSTMYSSKLNVLVPVRVHTGIPAVPP